MPYLITMHSHGVVRQCHLNNHPGLKFQGYNRRPPRSVCYQPTGLAISRLTASTTSMNQVQLLVRQKYRAIYDMRSA